MNNALDLVLKYHELLEEVISTTRIIPEEIFMEIMCVVIDDWSSLHNYDPAEISATIASAIREVNMKEGAIYGKTN